MVKDISEESIRNMLKEVKHPAIDRSLLDRGIIKEIDVREGKIVITIALPFPNIPIIDQLINSMKEPIEKIGVEVKIKQTGMKQEGVQKFLMMEQENWKGSM